MNIDLSKYDIPSGVGQYSFNHEGCPAGVDTKKRLYIKVISNGNLVAYCHHCGNKGFRFQSFGKFARISDHMQHDDQPHPHAIVEVPDDLVKVTPAIPHAYAYLAQYGVENMPRYKYSPKWDAIAMFPNDFNGEGEGFVLRHLSGNRRYTTAVKSAGTCSTRTITLVEDHISASRINHSLLAGHRAATGAAFPLYGCGTKWIPTLLRCEIAYVWLDDDLAGNKGTVTVVRHLQQLGVEAVPIYAPQPKNLTDEEIAEVYKKAS